MGKNNLYDNLLVKKSLAPVTLTASANGTAVDRAEDGCYFQEVLVLVQSGVLTDGTYTIEVQESDDNSTFTAAADADLDGDEPAIAATDDGKVWAIGYRGAKRYVRVAVTVASASSGGLISAAIVLGNPRNAPVTQDN